MDAKKTRDAYVIVLVVLSVLFALAAVARWLLISA